MIGAAWQLLTGFLVDPHTYVALAIGAAFPTTIRGIAAKLKARAQAAASKVKI